MGERMYVVGKKSREIFQQLTGGVKMTFDRIFLYGDSFVDNKRLNSHKYPIRKHYVSDEDLPKLWTEQLKSKINHNEFFNFGKIATGPTHTIDLIKEQNFSSNDLLIVNLSFHDIFSVKESGFFNDLELYKINFENQEYIHSLKCTTIVSHNYYDTIMEHQYTFPLSMNELSFNEIIAKYDDICQRRWDRRINHLSWKNHDILSNCILKMIDGFNDFNYYDFEYKFLTLDEAYHPELVINKKEQDFIYE